MIAHSSLSSLSQGTIHGQKERRELSTSFFRPSGPTIEPFGFGTAETFPGLPIQAIQEELASVPIPERMTYERECRDELIRRIRLLPNTTEHRLVTAFGHGDLSVGNIVVTGSGALFVIDWETAGQMPIVWDLRKLMHGARGFLPSAIELLRAELQQLGWRDAMSAEDQFLLGLGARVAERSRGAHRAAQFPDLKRTLKALRQVGKHCLIQCSISD